MTSADDFDRAQRASSPLPRIVLPPLERPPHANLIAVLVQVGRPQSIQQELTPRRGDASQHE